MSVGPSNLVHRALNTIISEEPHVALRLFSILLNIVSIIILTYCLYTRWPTLQAFRQSPWVTWINILLYIDSLLFTTSLMMIRYAYGLSKNLTICHAAVMICLTLYLLTKLLIYFYFVERAFLVWAVRGARRATNKMYLFNMIAILGCYIVIIVLSFIFRTSFLNHTGECVIGIEHAGLIPLVSYEMAVNIYLTFLFLWPVRKTYSWRFWKNSKLKSMAIRCLVGTVITCLSTGSNLTVLAVLDGEPGWLCLLTCNVDSIICVLVIHWITSNTSQKRKGNLTDRSGGDSVGRTLSNDQESKEHISTSQFESIKPGVSTRISHGSGSSHPVPEPHTISVHMAQVQKFERRPSDQPCTMRDFLKSSDSHRDWSDSATTKLDDEDAIWDGVRRPRPSQPLGIAMSPPTPRAPASPRTDTQREQSPSPTPRNPSLFKNIFPEQKADN